MWKTKFYGAFDATPARWRVHLTHWLISTQVNMFANPTMNKAILGAQIALYVALFVPGLSDAVIGLYPLGSPAGRTDGIEWFGWVLALIGALVCMTGCELYKCYVKHFAPPPI